MKKTTVSKDTELLIDKIVNTYQDDSGINFIDVKNLPVREKIIEVLDLLIEIIFPGYTGKQVVTRDNVRFVVGELLCRIRDELNEQIYLALNHLCRIKKDCGVCDCKAKSAKVTEALLNSLVEIREMLKHDVEAAFDGDPAADSFEEVVISYPYIMAIAIHRIAHELYKLDVPLIPRIMSESAHSATGIDIHPGATIGKRCFIDHGTGVVIGETAVLGDNVKIYQGVTLGAISFPKDETGRAIKGQKRHPTIEDDVTIYAEATILGDITVGKGAIIGGNVWIKKAVEPGTMVSVSTPDAMYKQRKKK